VRKGQTYQGDSYDSLFLKCFQEEKLLSGCKILGKSRIKIKINGTVKKIIIPFQPTTSPPYKGREKTQLKSI
jgi:hypothetical protein